MPPVADARDGRAEVSRHGAALLRVRLAPRVYVTVVLLMLVAAGGYLAGNLGRGSTRAASVRVLSGLAYTNATLQTSVDVDGWEYNIPRGVAWVNAQGSYVNSSQTPSCLRPGRSAKISFGATPIDVGQTGASIRSVVWVKCR